jgi:hypothetical protein
MTVCIVSSYPTLNPLSCRKQKAGEKIVRWAKNCLFARRMERKMRAQVLRGAAPRFNVERVIRKVERDELCREVEGIVAYYESPEGQMQIRRDRLGWANYDMWEDIHVELTSFSSLPIVVRNRRGKYNLLPWFPRTIPTWTCMHWPQLRIIYIKNVGRAQPPLRTRFGSARAWGILPFS